MISALNKKILEIKTREDFIEFMHLFCEDYANNSSSWENNKLETFLEALTSYSEDIDGYYQNIKKQPIPQDINWQVFAELLMGARIYE